MAIQNVAVDGLNLAFRCFFVPGLRDIQDSTGRRTGVIYGFLKTLASLRKKFPGCTLWVAWDGVDHKRKALYPEYKANRVRSNTEGNWDQVKALQSILPLIGVNQIGTSDSEADDCIATLITRDLHDQESVILSTDRDFLQLVSETVSLLTPAQGKKPETIHTPEIVRENWGVPPEKMLQLRALEGDTSDNIPGVPRVPNKILVDLVNLYGTVEGIFASNLAGLTPSRYTKIREAEKQVRVNLELMCLNRNVQYVLVPGAPDRDQLAQALNAVEIKSEPLLPIFFAS